MTRDEEIEVFNEIDAAYAALERACERADGDLSVELESLSGRLEELLNDRLIGDDEFVAAMVAAKQRMSMRIATHEEVLAADFYSQASDVLVAWVLKYEAVPGTVIRCVDKYSGSFTAWDLEYGSGGWDQRATFSGKSDGAGDGWEVQELYIDEADEVVGSSFIYGDEH